MGRAGFFLFTFLFALQSWAPPFPTVAMACNKALDGTLAATQNLQLCNWDVSDLNQISSTAGGVTTWTCIGRMVCPSNTDPYLALYPFEIKLIKCTNGTVKCDSVPSPYKVSATCRASAITNERNLCNAL
jgi:hypothetical protein